MSGEPIGPGDAVVATTYAASEFGQRIHEGRIYIISEVLPGRGRGHCHICGAVDRPGLRASGETWPEDYAWCHTRFRPISRRSHFETILLQLKSPAPKRETEDA